MNTIEHLPQTSYFWHEGLMRKCSHNVITKGYAPRVPGYRTCCTCYQITWIPVDDNQYITEGKYDEEKIKDFAIRDNVPYSPVLSVEVDGQ